jgi:hypothetical protein
MSEDKGVPRVPKNRGDKREQDAVVRELFGDREEIPLDPDGIRPVNDKKKTRERVRIGVRFSEVLRRVEAGEITMREFVQTLTPEELVRGQLRAEDGTFRGAPPKFIPAEFYQECTRELLKRGEVLWKDAYHEAIKVFTAVANNENFEPKDRLKAAQYIIERVAGKTPERIEVAQAQPWETLISGIVAEAEEESISRAARILAGSGGDDE